MVRSFLILDDCLFCASWTKDRNIRSLFANPPSLLLIAMGYPMRIPPMMREKLDYVFLFKDTLVNNRRRMWEQYATDMFPCIDSFSQAMDQFTGEDHTCLVIDKRDIPGEERTFLDRVFWYKAEPRDSFRIGADEFWAPDATISDDASDDAIYKVTMFMTPQQWDRLSAWSAPLAGNATHQNEPWLMLFHEADMRDEYNAMKKAQAALRMGTIVYETPVDRQDDDGTPAAGVHLNT